MANYKRRSKINPKIIFNNILKNTQNALVIGENNFDIVEVLKSKNIILKELEENKENKIINSLENFEDNKFEVIILNLELSNFEDIKSIILNLINKSNYCVIRFRNNNHDEKITKKVLINKIIKDENIKIFKKIFGKQNKISNSIFFKPFAYYTVYFITKNTYATNFELSLMERIKSFIILLNKKITFAIWKVKS
ncbi:MAG TPA: hypothetical protein VLL98_04510 [Rickettsiales bacterium]|nr:hypothetical protein [Rickettsiales bacterium]